MNQQYITDIRKSFQEAIQILNELLMYDKIESGMLELDISPFKAIELMQSIEMFEVQVCLINNIFTTHT